MLGWLAIMSIGLIRQDYAVYQWGSIGRAISFF
jgi:hypothetical protein